MFRTQNKPQTQRIGFNFGHGNRKVNYKMATWNILGLYRSGACQNLVEVLGTYKVKIAALQEIRWKGTGQVTVKDYEIYFSGMVETDTVLGAASLCTGRWYHILKNLDQLRKE